MLTSNDGGYFDSRSVHGGAHRPGVRISSHSESQDRGLEMKTHVTQPSARATILATLVTLALVPGVLAVGASDLVLPWSEAGLSEREAAAHLLDRFAFGARPGEVDQVLAMGLEVWLEQQLAADLPDPIVEQRLEGYHTLGMSASELKDTYPIFFRIRRQAERPVSSRATLSCAPIVGGPHQEPRGKAGRAERTARRCARSSTLPTVAATGRCQS